LVRQAVADAVAKQVEVGIDVVGDGEQSKVGYSTYVKDRLEGFGSDGRMAVTPGDLVDYPGYAVQMFGAFAFPLRTPACIGPVRSKGTEAVQRDIAHFKEALAKTTAVEAFMTAASPGVIALFLSNAYYRTDEEYLNALADAMRPEYQAIHEAGFLLQIDCPDLAMGRHIQFPDRDEEEFRKIAELHVEVLNRAVEGIPPDRMRLHLCWGNYEGPHHKDISLERIIDIVLRARPMGISFEAANPRHEHEWRLFERIRIPDDKVLIPGVIDSTTNFIEHPDLVAERIKRFAAVVGTERIIAGTDCGFGTFAGYRGVDPAIAWAKLGALAEGARLASRELWN
jgi:5-methyltetrahydropteroyltriglutamate--homocysteine methyltransferase